jgi:hypothetical protein
MPICSEVKPAMTVAGAHGVACHLVCGAGASPVIAS